MKNNDHKGLVASIIAFALWGALPIYWKMLHHVGSLEILCHRILWAFVFLVLLISFQKKWQATWVILKSKRNLTYLFFSSVLVSANWFIYIWAVNNGQILQSSLGYYINPILNVIVGIIIFKEQLTKAQWLAVGLAFSGVMFLTISNGVIPSLALAIAFTFCIYGALHKILSADAIIVLMLETAFLAVPSLAYLFSLPDNAFGSTALTTTLLVGAGIITAVPLLLFVYASDKVNFTTLGIVQYLAPTGQLISGIFLFGEIFSTQMQITFSLIWSAVIIYSISKFRRQQRKIIYS